MAKRNGQRAYDELDVKLVKSVLAEAQILKKELAVLRKELNAMNFQKINHSSYDHSAYVHYRDHPSNSSNKKLPGAPDTKQVRAQYVHNADRAECRNGNASGSCPFVKWNEKKCTCFYKHVLPFPPKKREH